MIKKYRFLILRRLIQISIIALFMLSSFYSINFLSGNLSFSKIFNTIPMSDPLSIMQILISGGALGNVALLGLAVVLLIYGLLFGRGYCAFVCPMNIVTDSANFLRRYLGITNKKFNIQKKLKYYVFGLSLVLSLLFMFPAFDAINPVSMLHRGLIFGMGYGLFIVISIFLFDLLFLKNGFCSYICPIGVTYSLIGKYSLIRIKHNHKLCTKCNKCFSICPEPHVLDIIGKDSATINNIDCIKCARCVEVCDDNALNYGILKRRKI